MKRQITALLAGGVLALALFGEAKAGPLEDFDAAYQHGDFAAAVQLLRPLADQGNALAQTSLGIMYAKAKASRRTTCRPSSGFARWPTKGTPPRRTLSA